MVKDWPLKLIKNGRLSTEYRFRQHNGQYRWMLDEVVLVRDIADAEFEVVGFMLDITPRKHLARQVNEQNVFLQTLLDTIPNPIFYKDVDGRYAGANPAFERFLGLSQSDIIGKIVFDLASRDLAAAYDQKDRELLQDLGIQRYETQIKSKSGEIRDVIFNKAVFNDNGGNPAGIIGVISDVSSLKQAEQEYRSSEIRRIHARKMEAIGTLAGGIAHDFNNLLAVILGNVEYLENEFSALDSARESLMEARQASLEAKALIRQILDYSRPTLPDRQSVNIRILVKETLKLMRATIPSSVKMEQRISNRVHSVLADPHQLNQVIMNLCTNAAQAMKDRGGTLTISLADIRLETPSQRIGMDLKPGDYVCLTVADNGPGISPEIIHRIFEPYFTTRPLGQGSGMGLAVVYGIVRGHDGVVAVESLVDEGTMFHVYLPAANNTDESTGHLEKTMSVFRGGLERILVVDDQESILKALKRVLSSLGYQVTCHKHPFKALEDFRLAPQGVDLVITDMTMPDMTGDVLSRAIWAIRADMPIIMCTGHSDNMDESAALAMGIRAFAVKPLSMENLTETIRRVLDGNGSS